MNICFYYLPSKTETARTGEISTFFSKLVYGTEKRFLTVLHASANILLLSFLFFFCRSKAAFNILYGLYWYIYMDFKV